MAKQCCKYDYDHDGNCHIHQVDKRTRMPQIGADKVYDVIIEKDGALYYVFVSFGYVQLKESAVAFTKWGAERKARRMIRKRQKKSKVTRLRMTSEGEIIKRD